MSRITLSRLRTFVSAATAVAIVVSVADQKKLNFTAKVNGSDIATDTGKIKMFSDVDSVIKLIGAMTSDTQEVTASVEGAGLLRPAPKLNTPAAIKASRFAEASAQVLKLTEYKVVADKQVADAVAAGWNTGNALERATHAEYVAEATAVADSLTEAQQRKTANQP